jgi:thiol-disulfide isomerase/thioredoxin
MLSKPTINNDSMKTQKKSLVLLVVAIMICTLWCCNSGKTNTENFVREENLTDDYYFLRNPDIMLQRTPEDLSGKVIVLSESDFIERITDLDNPKGFQYKGITPCVVELYANWCKPSGYMSQVLDEVAPEYQGEVIFYKIDLDKARNVVNSFSVKKMPVLLYFKPREAISKTVGFLNHSELRNAVEEYLLKP